MRQDGGEAVEHSICAPNHVKAETRVGLIQPAGQSNPTGNRIGFRDRPPLIGQDEVRPDDTRERVAAHPLARILDESRRFTDIKIARHPFRLLPFDALLVELITGALKNEKLVAEALEISPKFFFERKWFRRNQPFFFGEEALLWPGLADGSETIDFREHEAI